MKNRKRTPRGRGSVIQRADGRWEARLHLGFDPQTGKRVRRFVYGATAEEADAKLAALKARIRAGVEPKHRSAEARGTFGAFLDDWLANGALRLRASTLDDYQRQVRLRVKPLLGKIPLDRVTPQHISAVDAGLAQSGTGLRTRKKLFDVLRAAFRYALRQDLIQRSPMDRVTAPSYRAAEREPYTVAEVRQLMQAIAGHRLEALFLVAFQTGIREGELFGLLRSDVDLERGVIHIRRQLQDVNGQRELADVKTEHSRRAIDLPPRALALLRWHLRGDRARDSHVFTDTKGGPLRRSNFLRDTWYPLIKKAELREVTFHDLRHTCGTLMVEAGENIEVVSRVLGHADIRITAATYAHVNRGLRAGALDRLEWTLHGEVVSQKVSVTAKRRSRK